MGKRCNACRVITVILLVIGLAACTSKMTYRFLDWFVEWAVDDYIQWDNIQQRDFDERLTLLLDWHQLSQLPQYSQWLQQLQSDFQQPLHTRQLEQHLRQVEQFWGTLTGRIAVDAAALLGQLSDEQVVQLIEKLRSETAKKEKKYRHSSMKRLNTNRLKMAQKISKRWLGRLTADQQQLIKQWNKRHRDSWSHWLEYRKTRANEFELVLQERQLPDFEQRIGHLFTRSRASWSPQYRATMEANTANTMALIVTLQQTLTEKQKRHLNLELTQWIQIFADLADEARENTDSAL